MKSSYVFERQRELENQKNNTVSMADIWDRLAAFVFDIIFLIMVTNLIFAPIKKKLQIAILNEHDGAAQIYFALMVVGFVILFVGYHALSVFYFKKTIGKKLFGLEVRSSLDQTPLSLGNCVLRAVAQCVSILLLCFPFLQVFSHKVRRPLHDRVSDSFVFGLRKKGKAPDTIEKLWVKVVFAIILANFVAVGFVQMYFLKLDIANLTELITEPEYVCDEVSEAKDNWPNHEHLSRMDMALTLFAAGEIGKECLDLEAQKYISYEQQLDKAYLAKAFSHEDKSQISNDYLKKVCEIDKNSESCTLTKMIQAWADKKWDDVDQMLQKNAKIQTPFLTVWAVQHYDRKQDYAKVLILLNTLTPNKALNNFIGKYKTVALWGMDRKNEAEELFQTTYANLPSDTKNGFLADMCRLEADNNCANEHASGCHWLNNEMYSDDLEYHQAALISLVKSQKCGVADIDEIIVRYRDLVDDPRLQIFLAASKAEKVGKKAVAEQLYRNLLESSDEGTYLNYEVRSHLVSLAPDKKNLADMASWWIKTPGFNNYHQLLGMQLLKTLSHEKIWDVALQVSQKFYSKNPSSPDALKEMAVIFYKTNKMTLAKKMINQIDSQNSNSRGIASEDEYSLVRSQLRGQK